MIGIDTALISRVEKALGNTAFKNAVFTDAEQQYCDGRKSPAESYAGLFCAKEAAVKALRCGFGKIRPNEIVIYHDECGAPSLMFFGAAKAAFDGFDAHVSISHDGDHAVAAVLLTPVNSERQNRSKGENK